MSVKRLLVVSLFSLFLIASRTEASDYYVSATLGQSTNPGTLASPLRAIREALQKMSAGDRLFVMPGTYQELLHGYIPSGISTRPTIIQAQDSTRRPVLLPVNNRIVRFDGWDKTSFGSNSHIVIDGFVIDAKRDSDTGVYLSSPAHHITIRNCEVKNAKIQGILLEHQDNEFNVFQNLDVHDNGSSTQLDHGIYSNGRNNIIEDSKFYRNAAYGVQIYSDGKMGATNNTIVRRNLIFGQANKAGAVISSGDGIQFYDNVVYENSGGGIQVSYGARNALIAFNTFVRNGEYDIWVHNAGAGLTTENIRVANNIAAETGSTPYRLEIISVTFEHNLSDREMSRALVGSPSVQRNNIFAVLPRFVDSSNDNFRLEIGSPASNMGISIEDIFSDFDGYPRSMGGAPDLGAFEIVSRPEAPLNLRVLP